MMHLGEQTLYVAVGTVFVLATVVKVYNVLKSPLSKLPGDELSKWTGSPWWWTQIAVNRISFQHAAHKRYGPVVRLSPTDVAISDPTAINQIFAFGSGFLKSSWYLDFANERDGEGVFSTITPYLHQQRRRLLATAMSESSLSATSESEIRRLCRFCIERMQNANEVDGAFDVLRWWSLMATDVIGNLTFGDSFHMLEHGKENQYVRDLHLGAPIAALSGAFPILAKIIQVLPLGGLPGIWGSHQRSYMWAKRSIQRYRSLTDNGLYPRVRETLFSKIWKVHGVGSISDHSLSVEARFYLIAGTDTTSSTLTYLIYELTRHQEYQQTLIDEISHLPSNFTSKDVLGLRGLSNAITETLRLHGPVQNSLPRVVPAGGMTVAGHYLPHGTTVHPQAYTLHRNPAIYPDPEDWKPERWQNPTREMKDNFLAWGAGSRICMGKNLAMMEMALAVAEFYRAFSSGVRLATERGTSDVTMEHTEYSIAVPKVRSCWVTPMGQGPAL